MGPRSFQFNSTPQNVCIYIHTTGNNTLLKIQAKLEGNENNKETRYDRVS